MPDDLIPLPLDDLIVRVNGRQLSLVTAVTFGPAINGIAETLDGREHFGRLELLVRRDSIIPREEDGHG